MAAKSKQLPFATPHWSASDPAVHVEWQRADDGSLRVWMLRHPTYPYQENVVATADDLEVALQAVAQRYVVRVAEIAGIEAVAAQLKDGLGRDGFGWLDIGWGQGLRRDPRLSFWLSDTQLVLLAGNQVRSVSGQHCLGLQTGLRVLLQVHSVPAGACSVSIIGLSVSGLERAQLPGNTGLLAPLLAARQGSGSAAPWGNRSRAAFDEKAQTTAAALGDGFRQDTDVVARHLGGQASTLAVGGYSAISASHSQASGTLIRGHGAAARVYAWAASIEQNTLGVRSVQQSQLVELVTGMATAVQLVGRDPPSAGPFAHEYLTWPTAKSASLDGYRRLAVGLPADSARPNFNKLNDEQAGGPRFQVLVSRVVDGAAPVDAVQSVADGPLELRSDAVSAVHAYQRGRELFTRMELYGLDAADCFRQVRLPLLLRHRAGFNSAPDGHTVNAEVRFVDTTPGLHEPADTATWPQLEVGFGAANLTHKPLWADSKGIFRAQPLGLAADPRWAWHEFGHVLLAASTGELEFRFAHSVGDALAAIVADPDSQLATQVHAPGSDAERLRLLTFPWVRTTRSHGHSAALGWCWCGRRSRRRLLNKALLPELYTDYFEEQLLSASMFTLYSALGGLPGNTAHRRFTASHYSVYLIMWALKGLGIAAVVPAATPDQWVSALIDADRRVANWAVNPSPLGQPTGSLNRNCAGGAHKVIRWAFENQGLYATATEGEVVEGKGLAPAVDVYIRGLDGRDAGGYTPVPLTWVDDPDEPAPLWHASPSALYAAAGEVRLVVGNRGAQQADAVQVRCWVAPMPTVGVFTWTELTPCVVLPTAPLASVGAGATASFCFNAPATAGSYLVLGQVSCPADRANLDPAAGLPFTTGLLPANAADLTDWVANEKSL